MINYIDTHIHLDLIDDIKRATEYIEANHIYVIAMTNHPKVYEIFSRQINSKYIRVALGMHPELIDRANLALFAKHIDSTKYIGEVGLDFACKNTDQEQQKNIFNEIIRISKKKIISIHSRSAESIVLDIIERNFDNSSTYIMHWYSGNKKDLLRAIDLGCHFSINYSMIESKKAQDLLHLLPINKILIESDSPFSKGNIYNLQSTYYELAKVLNIPQQILIAQVYENFKYILIKSID